ncbi:hypothetical protein ABW19_dt0207974 [Dactylella cylindrospora]|nr:hypothetical protein ABW19_dt0207974 [Dactylella cylindrospora]
MSIVNITLNSLCYQLPALIEHGITIVVSPLLSLMSNQVSALRKAGVLAASLNSTTNRDEKRQIMEDLECGHPKTRLLYVTPELCATNNFRNKLKIIHRHRELSRIAIDEAHCISEWGHEFRPTFKELSYFKREFPTVPIMALTATATARVRQDIISILGLPEPPELKLFTISTYRPNLHYEVRYKSDDDDHFEDLLDFFQRCYQRRELRNDKAKFTDRITSFSGIIYCIKRDTCEALAARLREKGIGAKPYHAGLDTAEKERVLHNWRFNEPGYDVIVATTAFGMGIDKPDVRFVIHWQIPKSFEGFYQEAGRAGRDGKAALCMLYYGREDRDRNLHLLNLDLQKKRKKDNTVPDEAMDRIRSFEKLVNYCEATSKCRHAIISDYFGESNAPTCNYACDWHKEPQWLENRKRRGLASEDFCATQRQTGMYDEYYDDY